MDQATDAVGRVLYEHLVSLNAFLSLEHKANVKSISRCGGDFIDFALARGMLRIVLGKDSPARYTTCSIVKIGAQGMRLVLRTRYVSGILGFVC